MKSKVFSLGILILFISCKETSQKKSEKKSLPTKEIKRVESISNKEPETINEPDKYPDLQRNFKDYTVYPLTDTIKIDFNGDRMVDEAYFNSKKNLIIKDGKSQQENKIKNASDNDFDWVEYWAVTNDKKTFEITIVNYDLGSEVEIPLEYPSIIIRKEGIGGAITFKNGEYKWIHQAD